MANELLKELGIEGVAELIAERFDDAIDLMHSDAIVYGGAIRDILAGLPLEGDLDIATDGYSYRDTSRNFRNSPKWTEKGRRWRPSSMPAATKSGRTSSNKKFSIRRDSPSSPYGDTRSNPYEGTSMPVADTTSFVTFNSAQAQIVMSKGQSKESFDAALEIVRHVDFVCCGLAMDNTGRIFEVIEGAYEDCKNKVLRLNKSTKNINVDNLKERVTKLKKRGWESKINISAVKRKMEKAHKAKTAEQERQMKAQQKEMKNSLHSIKVCDYIRVSESKTGPFKNYSVDFNRRAYEESFGARKRDFVGLTRILSAISNTATNVGLKITHKPGPEGHVQIRIMSKKVTGKKAHYYAAELQNVLEGLAFEFDGKSSKKKLKKKAKKSPYDAFGDVSNMKVSSSDMSNARVSSFGDREMSAKLRGRPTTQHEAMPTARRDSESVHPADDSGVESMSFKAVMAPDGQIMINPIEEGGSNPSDDGVTIDVSDLPPEAAQQLRNALENTEPADVPDLRTPEEVPARGYGVRVPDSELQEMGRASDEDSYPDVTSIGEDPDERSRER